VAAVVAAVVAVVAATVAAVVGAAVVAAMVAATVAAGVAGAEIAGALVLSGCGVMVGVGLPQALRIRANVTVIRKLFDTRLNNIDLLQ